MSLKSLSQKIGAYYRLMRFDRPIGTYLLLWPTLWGVWVAGNGRPAFSIIVIFVLGVVIMRAAGSVINDIADRHIDGHVKRTVQRPLVTGEVTVLGALCLFAFLLFCALCLVLCLNLYTLMLALVGVGLASIYPFTKRFFPCPQFFLGLAWSWGIVMAFAAQQQQVPLVAWLLYLAHIFLTLAYDTMYAMVDRDDDLHIGVQSNAILLGHFDKFGILIYQIIVLGLLWAVAEVLQFGNAFYIALSIGAGILVYQQYLIKDRDRTNCLRAFLYSQWFGLAIFLGIVVAYW